MAYSTPKLSIIAPRDNRTIARRPQDVTDLIEYTNKSLCISTVQSVLGCLSHGNDKDVAIVTVEGYVRLVND